MQKITQSLFVVSLCLFIGACSMFGGGDKAEKNVGPRPTAIGINGFLWQATLETLSFMPLEMIEPSGGVIVTDWHTTADLPDERVKVTVRFLSEALRSDGFKVSVVRQERAEAGWQSVPVQAATELQIEEAILTAARRMRVEARN